MRWRSMKRMHTVRRRDCKVLAEALKRAGATEFDVYAASILLAANGLKNALAYVRYVRKRNREARRQAQSMQCTQSVKPLD